MALSLRDVQRDTIANRALKELMHHYTVAEEKSLLVLTKKAGDMKLFLHDLDDLHQLDFVHNQIMVKEIERLGVRSTTIEQQRESWKVRALIAEAQLLEATAKTTNNDRCQNISDVRYASLKRYLAKRFHPDYAPGEGIEKILRNEFFKEIWNEIERLDQGVSATRFATARSTSSGSNRFEIGPQGRLGPAPRGLLSLPIKPPKMIAPSRSGWPTLLDRGARSRSRFP